MKTLYSILLQLFLGTVSPGVFAQITVSAPVKITRIMQVTPPINPIVTASSATGTRANLLYNVSAVSGSLSVVSFTVGGVTTPAGSTYTIPNTGNLMVNADGSYSFTPVVSFTGAVPLITANITDGTNTNSARSLGILVSAAAINTSLNFGIISDLEDLSGFIPTGAAAGAPGFFFYLGSSSPTNPATIYTVAIWLGASTSNPPVPDPTKGSFTATDNAGVTVVSGSGTAFLTLSGTLDDLNTYLVDPALRPQYIPPPDVFTVGGGCMTLQYRVQITIGTVNQDGQTRNGNITSRPDTYAYTVAVCTNRSSTFNVLQGTGMAGGSTNAGTANTFTGQPATVTAINGAAYTPGTPIVLANGQLTVGTNGYITFTSNSGFTGNQTFTYTARPNNTGCAETRNVTITVSALPVITGTTTVNAGQTTQLTGSASPAASNPWVSSDMSVATVSNTGLVTGVAAGTVTITYTNNRGCTATATVTVNASTPTYCYHLPITDAVTTIPSKHGITSLGRAGADNSNWPMVRQSAWTVLEAKTKGFVVNRVPFDNGTGNPVGIDTTNFVKGMMVYDSTNNCLKIYNGSIWSCYSTPACP